MEDILKIIGEYGILIVIAAVFIWDKITNAKTTDNILKELQEASKLQVSTLESLSGTLEGLRRTCENQTTALNIIQNTLSNNTSSLERHDKRAEYMNSDIRAIAAVLKLRPGADSAASPEGITQG